MEYLELLLSTYKALHSDKVKGAIFGNKGNGKDLDAMEIDVGKKEKAKEAKFT